MGCQVRGCKRPVVYESNSWDSVKIELCRYHIDDIISCACCGCAVPIDDSKDGYCPICSEIMQSGEDDE